MLPTRRLDVASSLLRENQHKTSGPYLCRIRNAKIMTESVLESTAGLAGAHDQAGGEQATPIRVLLVEDEPLYAKLVMHRLTSFSAMPMRPAHVSSLTDATSHLSATRVDVVLLDLMLPESCGIDTLVRVREVAPHVPVVVLTGHGVDDLISEALRNGAQDYLIKGNDEGLVVRSIRYAIERCRAREDLEKSQASLRQTQAQLLQIDKMDSIGRLAAGIAHEVRNPLAVIQMGIDFLKKSAVELSEDIAETFNDMESAVDRSYGIIKGLLDFCVPTEMHWESLSINSCICQIMPMFRHEIRKHEIEFVPEMDGALPNLMLDRNKIKQALLHLVLNAIDAMPDGGILTVRTFARPLYQPKEGAAKPALDEPGQYAVTVEVTDTGCGIPEEVLSKIHDPFFTTKLVGSATGLGLSITKNIVELHGGRIDIKNSKEGGVRATITFVP